MTNIIYGICLVVGLIFTLISVMVGHFFGSGEHVAGSGGHVEAGADSSDAPGISIFSPTIIASFITAFGGFGLIFTQFHKDKCAGNQRAALACSAVWWWQAALFVFLRSVFRHTQSSSESHVAQLIGAEANVITPIPENGVGEIAYVVGGTRYSAPARAENNAAMRQRQDRQNHPHRRDAVLRPDNQLIHINLNY